MCLLHLLKLSFVLAALLTELIELEFHVAWVAPAILMFSQLVGMTLLEIGDCILVALKLLLMLCLN